EVHVICRATPADLAVAPRTTLALRLAVHRNSGTKPFRRCCHVQYGIARRFDARRTQRHLRRREAIDQSATEACQEGVKRAATARSARGRTCSARTPPPRSSKRHSTKKKTPM